MKGTRRSGSSTEPESTALTVEHVTAADVRPLRTEVLRAGQPPSSTCFDGDDHPLAAHVAARSDVTGIVSVGSVYPDPAPWEPDRQGAWRIRGMATSEPARGKGLGRRVLDALMEHAMAHDGDLIWCNARTGALDFYRKAGFETVGEEFDDGIALHQSMRRALRDPTGSSDRP